MKDRDRVPTALSLRLIEAQHHGETPHYWFGFNYSYWPRGRDGIFPTLAKIVDNRGDGIVENLDRLLDYPNWRRIEPGIYKVDDPEIANGNHSGERCIIIDYRHDGTAHYEREYQYRTQRAQQIKRATFDD